MKKPIQCNFMSDLARSLERCLYLYYRSSKTYHAWKTLLFAFNFWSDSPTNLLNGFCWAISEEMLEKRKIFLPYSKKEIQDMRRLELRSRPKVRSVRVARKPEVRSRKLRKLRNIQGFRSKNGNGRWLPSYPWNPWMLWSLNNSKSNSVISKQ